MRMSRVASEGTSQASTIILPRDDGSLAKGSGSREDKF